jgi:hypothetical protein
LEALIPYLGRIIVLGVLTHVGLGALAIAVLV